MQLRIVLDAGHFQALEQRHAVCQVNRAGTATGVLEVISIVAEDVDLLVIQG